MTRSLLPPELDREIARVKRRLSDLERRLEKRLRAEAEEQAFELDGFVVERTSALTISPGHNRIPFTRGYSTGAVGWASWNPADPDFVTIEEDAILLLTAAMSVSIGGSTSPAHYFHIAKNPSAGGGNGDPYASIGPLRHSGSFAARPDMHLDVQIVAPIEAGTKLYLEWHMTGSTSYPAGPTPVPTMGLTRIKQGIDEL